MRSIKIVSMYARGMSTREITGYLCDLYGIEVSADLISTVTDAVLDEVAAWQMRPLEPVYPLVFFDALRVKIRDESLVRNKAVHIALGVRADGAKEILGMWIEQNEGAKFWLRVMNELKMCCWPSWMASRAFQRQSWQSFQMRRSKPVLFISCATAWPSFPTVTGKSSQLS
jgi:hypothetical protein